MSGGEPSSIKRCFRVCRGEAGSELTVWVTGGSHIQRRVCGLAIWCISNKGYGGRVMYQALYRKWRPMVFSDVVGQRHVTDTLRKQVETGRLSHAYLFTGTRGTGKTTCAKILAKAANCLRPVKGEPCNECPSCVGINNGSITDVSEIDAASYTGVDNIRAIRDETAYTPSEAKMRVYIIDECHMLSTGANNALLKTLEEPPPHVIFILATTELNKVPATILSRCQLFTFRRLQPEDIAVRLKEIAAAEKIPLEPDAAELLARIADGAMRDAISMLDQCAASTTGTIGTEQVLSVIGLSTASETLRLARALAAGDSGTALDMLSEMYSGGKDLVAVLNELAALLRDLLVLKTTKNSKLLIGNYDRSEIDGIDIGRIRLMNMINTIQDTLSGMRQSPNRRIDAELCLIKLCDPTLAEGYDGLAARVERLEDIYRNLGNVKVSPAYVSEGPNDPSFSLDRSQQAQPGKSVDNYIDNENRKTGDIIGNIRDNADGPGDNEKTVRDEDVRRNIKSYNAVTLERNGPQIEMSGQDPVARGRDSKAASETSMTDGDRDPASPANINETQLWKKILQRVKPKLEVSKFSFLNTIQNTVLQGSRLCIVTDSPMIKNVLDKPEIKKAIGEEASIILGKDISVDIVNNQRLEYEQTRMENDPLKKLIDRKNELDNIRIED